MPQPVHLFASAYPDPSTPSKSLHNLLMKLEQMDLNLFALDQELIGQLNEQQLVTLATIFKENGIVDYSDERMNKSIIQVLLPIFIGDMKIVRNYTYQDEPPLSVATSVFLGTKDSWVAPEDHWGWANHSLVPCQFHQFDSGHLFVREKEVRTKIIQKISNELVRFSQLACEV
ncbi:hypothetical protein LDG_5849 [Legionella drancourtii LLAP12]|uniref:Thioesterase domain-containing protein n=1 Tax=Legionella drancourtii LLAP12 TaxID=658187 RepID=G9EKV5_9GAMM|nr:hypothetical protein LDG_5849 [Legionella drancourtii LLAP12]